MARGGRLVTSEALVLAAGSHAVVFCEPGTRAGASAVIFVSCWKCCEASLLCRATAVPGLEQEAANRSLVTEN